MAFLRAINLGATRKFPKDDLRRVTEEAGFDDVATYINTGNVRLTTRMRSTDKVATTLEYAYAADRGFAVPTVVLTLPELAQVAADAEEIGAGHEGTRYVSLLRTEPTPEAVAALEALSGDGETVAVRGRGAHLLVGDQAHTARLSNATVEKRLGVVATNRNVNVVRTLAQRWG